MTENLISVVLPIYNQADHIRPLVQGYIEAVSKVPYPVEYILVVNGSRDNSLEVCNELAAEFDCVRVLHSEKGGWGLAVKHGIANARGAIICFTNSARTKPQDLLLFLLYAIANPNVVIKANRKVRENWRRRIGSLLYNLECRTLFNLAYWDINGTPKVFPAHFERLRKLNEDGDLIDAEFNVICSQENYPMLEVPLVSVTRHGGKSTTNYASAVKMYWGAYKLWKTMGARGENR